MDFASITAAITGVRNATEIAKFIKDSGPTLAGAEQKLKLAELIDALADAKLAMAELKDDADKRESEIKRLQDALTSKATLKHGGVFYTSEGDNTPFCPRCWEAESRAMHVGPEVWDSKIGYYLRTCPQCKSDYKTRDAKWRAEPGFSGSSEF